jgi:hypothetical protein
MRVARSYQRSHASALSPLAGWVRDRVWLCRQVIDDRFARGEIEVDEHEQRRRALDPSIRYPSATGIHLGDRIGVRSHGVRVAAGTFHRVAA